MAKNFTNDDDLDRDTNDRNEDPLTGETGSHPVATGAGAALGGVAGGAAAGSVAGPVGTVAGAIIGGVAGGLAGKAVGEQIDPTAEDEYWRDEYKNRSYFDQDADYDSTFAPAYRYGYTARGQHVDRNFEDVEDTMRSDWESSGHHQSLSWDRARLAARDAWDRVGDTFSTGGSDESRVRDNDDVITQDDTFVVGEDRDLYLDDDDTRTQIPPKG